MKVFLGRFASILLTAGGWLLFGVRTVLDAIGYATLPDDAKVAAHLLNNLLLWILDLPGSLVLAFALISTMWLMWVSWPRNVATPVDTRNMRVLAGDQRDDYVPPKPKKGIKWNFVDSPSYPFIGMSMADGQVMVSQFQGQGTNNTDDPLTNVEAYLRSDVSGEIFPVLFRDDSKRSYVSSDKLLALPIGAFVDMRGFFTPDQTRMPYNEFMEKIGPFTFFFEYGGNQFRHSFTRRDIEDRKSAYFADVEKSQAKPPVPQFKQD